MYQWQMEWDEFQFWQFLQMRTGHIFFFDFSASYQKKLNFHPFKAEFPYR